MPKPTTSQNFNGTTLLHNNNNNNHSNNSSNSVISSSVLNNNSCTAAAQIMLNGFTKNSTPINNSVNFAQNNTTSDKLKGGGGGGGNDTKNNNLTSSSSAYTNVTDFDLPNLEAPKKVNNVKLHLPSPMYDRYPSKSLGQMKVYPITTPGKEAPAGQSNGGGDKVRTRSGFLGDHLCETLPFISQYCTPQMINFYISLTL